MIKPSLFFGYVKISEDGAMDCIIEAASQEASSAQEDAQCFIDFIERVEGASPHLTIRDWPAP
jgi:hypothetical protein